MRRIFDIEGIGRLMCLDRFDKNFMTFDMSEPLVIVALVELKVIRFFLLVGLRKSTGLELRCEAFRLPDGSNTKGAVTICITSF